MGQIAKLGTVFLLANRDVGWSFTSGVRPHQQVFEVTAGDVDTLVEAGREQKDLTLEIEDTGSKAEAGSVLKVKGLNVLQQMPTSLVPTGAVLVSDRRWKWQRKHILRRFNFRRKTGNRRKIEDEEVQFDQLLENVDIFGFAIWSLKPPGFNTPWTPLEALIDVLEEVNEDPVIIDLDQGELETTPIEGLEIDDPGDSAVNRILAFLPGVSLYVNAEGKVVVYNQRGKKENDGLSAVLKVAGPPIIGGQVLQFVDFSIIRPSKINVLFTREHELRFDSSSQKDPVTTIGGPDESRIMENVLPVPDVELEIELPGGAKETVVAGTWITFDQAIKAWNDSLPGPTIVGLVDIEVTPLSHIIIREGLPWFTGLLNHYVTLGVLDADIDWALRISTIRQHYRQTFRINRRWMDRLLTLRPNLATVIDPTTGIRAKARVYASFCMRPSNRGNIADGGSSFMGLNVRSHPSDVVDPGTFFSGKGDAPLAFGKASPAILSIVDPDLGIIRIDFRRDPLGRYDDFLPSIIDGLPTAEVNNLSVPGAPIRFWSEISSGVIGGLPNLREKHFVSILLSGIPAAPNNQSNLFRQEVFPSDVEAAFPSLKGLLTNSNGPEWTIRVGPTTETARMAWFDIVDTSIEESFGVVNADPDEGIASESINDFLRGILSNQNEVEDVAIAAAGVVYSALIDRWQGGKEVRMKPKMTPVGSLTSIQHRLSPTGAATTILNLPPELAKLDLFSLLDENTRRTIMKLVDPTL